MTIAETPLLQGQDITASYRMAQRRMLPSLVWGIVAVEVGIASRFAWERSWPWVGLFLLLAVSGLAFLQWWKARSEQSLRPAVVHSLLVVLWFSLLSYTFAAGPVESLGLYTLASLPLLAACFLSARDSSLWGGLSFFSGLAVWSFASDGLTSPLEPGASIRALTLFSWAHGAAFLIILLFLFLQKHLLETFKEYVERSAQQGHDATIASLELIEARDEAIAKAQAKSAFLANMSHEIRTPLNGVIGAASLLIDSSLELQQRNLVQTIQKSGELLLAIINDVLDLSKLEAGHVELEPQVFSIRECVENVLDLFAKAACDKEIDLAYQMEHNVHPRVEADAFRLQQVLINLVGNAVKFTTEGEVVVRISQERENVLRLGVHDTGIGIPEQEIHGLFQQFHQVETSTTRRFGGTGLGLAISKHLLSLMGGEIEVSSEVGKGTVFSFTLNATAKPLTEEDQEDFTELQGKRMLLLETQFTTRLCMVANASTWGMKVSATGSRQEAENWVRERTFDIALVSSSLQSSEDFAKRLSNLRPKMPIVCISSLTEAYSDTSIEDIVFSGVLLKPLRRGQILNVLTSVLTGRTLEARSRVTIRQRKWAEEMPLQILVAEDNPINQQVILQILERLGYTPSIVSHGLEVLDALSNKRYDMLLLDMQMPHMDGPTTSREIHKRWERSDRPYIVALTANVMQEHRKRFEEAGIDDFLGKPIQVEDLMRMLEYYAQQTKHQSTLLAPGLAPRSSKADFHTPARLAVVRASVSSTATLPILAKEPIEQLRELCHQGSTSFEELTSHHIANSKELFAEMCRSLDAMDAKALELAAHSLKSTSAMFGEEMVKRLCAQIEEAVQEELWEKARSSVQKIETALSMTHHALNSYLNDNNT